MFWRSKNLRKTKKAKKTYAFQKKRLKSTVFGVTFNPPQWYDKEKGLQKAGHASARQKSISEKFSEKIVSFTPDRSRQIRVVQSSENCLFIHVFGLKSSRNPP